MKNYFSLDCRF